MPSRQIIVKPLLKMSENIFFFLIFKKEINIGRLQGKGVSPASIACSMLLIALCTLPIRSKKEKKNLNHPFQLE